ncbi:MAG TPA: SAM-dependent methyltransferase, partial [Actinomycetota bacterium]|nr:SAM-dependent methyltransferase [Actinomycetota bacterium]
LTAVAADGADVVLLVKPQFEAGREAVGSGGVVRDPDAWRDVIGVVANAIREAGATPLGVIASPITGPAGNAEFLLHARASRSADPATLDVEPAIERAGELVRR